MTNPAGTRFAREVANYFKESGFPYAERRAQEGTKDRGDIAGVDQLVVECKATKAINLATAMKEAAQEAVNDGHQDFIVIHKRRMKPVSKSYVTMELDLFVEIWRQVIDDVLQAEYEEDDDNGDEDPDRP